MRVVPGVNQKSIRVLDDCGYFTSAEGISIRFHRWLITHCHPGGTIILLGGRKEFLEKYIETADDLNRMGFDVYSFDWRGQGLSSRMLPDGLKGYIRTYDDYLFDLQVFLEAVIPATAVRPIYLLAHSMGAHIALRYLHRHPVGIHGAVLSAPMIDICTDPYPKWLVRSLIRWALRIGRRDTVVPGSRKRSERDWRFEGNPLTSDPVRFDAEKRALKRNPALAVEAVTFAWLSATMESIDILKTPGYLEAIDKPILMVCAGADRVVSVEAQKAACARLPDCRIKIIAGSRHEILMERDAYRAVFWNEFIDFTGGVRR